MVVVYLLYGVHASFDAEGDGSIGPKNSDLMKSLESHGDQESGDPIGLKV